MKTGIISKSAGRRSILRPVLRLVVLNALALLLCAFRLWSAERAYVRPTEDEIAAFRKEIEAERVAEVRHDINGNIVSLTLRRGHATDEGLRLASSIASLRTLILHGSPIRTNDITKAGVSSLQLLTNLVTLKVLCIGSLPRGVFSGLCELTNIQEFQLTESIPPSDEYRDLTALRKLERLGIAHCGNFGDTEVTLLRKLSELRTLSLVSTGVTPDGTNVLSEMAGLTQFVFIPAQK